MRVVFTGMRYDQSFFVLFFRTTFSERLKHLAPMQCQTDKHDERLKKTPAMFAIFEPIGCEHWEARTASLAQRIVLQQVGSLSCSRNLVVGKMGCGLSDKGFEDGGLFCRVSCERFLTTC
jgi:hypothetical protein